MSTLTYDDLKFPVYVNSRIVGTVGGVPLTVSDAVNAVQLAQLNVFLAGKKGTGKTQLMRDLYLNRYGKKGDLIEGRPDLKADEIYKRVNLKKLREATSSDELIELAESTQFPFLGVDELNRCPEVTQNELLTIMNGETLYKGKPITLGKGFRVGMATGNLGNGGYVGTFKIDDALADRALSSKHSSGSKSGARRKHSQDHIQWSRDMWSVQVHTLSKPHAKSRYHPARDVRLRRLGMDHQHLRLTHSVLNT
jgi:MoxR-like ATPase